MPASEPQTIATAKPPRWKTLAVIVTVCAAIFFIVRTLAPQTIGEQARRVFEKQLADHYSDWDVSIRRGTYRPGIGLQFETIKLRPKSSAGSGPHALVDSLATWGTPPPVTIDSMTVFADVHPEKLLGDGSPLTTNRVVIEGAEASVSVADDGSISIAGLWPPPRLGPVCPSIELRSTTLNITAAGQTQRPFQLRCADIKMLTSASPTPTPTVRDPAAQGQAGHSPVHPVAARRIGGSTIVQDQQIHIRGDSDLCGGFQVDVRRQTNANGTKLTQVQSLVTQWKVDQGWLSRVEPWLPPSTLISEDTKFEGTGDFKVQLSHHARIGFVPEIDYEIDCTIHDAMVLDPRLPGEIRSVRGRWKCTPTRFELMPTTIQHGDSKCTAEASVDLNVNLLTPEMLAASVVPDSAITLPLPDSVCVVGFRNADIKLAAERLQVDRRYRPLLPSKGVALFDRFDPDGLLSLQARLRNQSPLSSMRKGARGLQAWQVDATVQCEGLDVTFEKFPYPVEELTGAIFIAGGQIEAKRLTGVAGGRRVHCAFRVPLKLSPDQIVSPEKTILIQTEGAIPIDDALIGALTPRFPSSSLGYPNLPRRLPAIAPQWEETQTHQTVSKLESFVRSLQPRGAVELASALIQTDSQGTTSRQFDLRVTSGAIRYEKFAYPLYNVTGRIQVRDDLVRLIGFTANNAGAAKIACDGIYETARTSPVVVPSELNLRFRVANLAMDQSLRVSLPESSRTIWDSLRPAGTLDQVDVHLKQYSNEPIDLSLRASHASTEETGANPGSLSIRPTALPYRIDIAGGQVRYQDNSIEITNLRGRHDASRLIADGRCEPRPDGQWWLRLDLESGCRLIPDEELIAALPDQMAWAMRGIDLRGPLGVRGVTNIRLPSEAFPDPALDWDVAMQMEGTRIGDVGPVHSIRGEIDVRGMKEGDIIRAGGRVEIDSLHAFGYQVTGIRGPFSIAGDDLRIGTLSSGMDPITGAPVAIGDGVKKTPAPLVGSLFGGIVDVSGSVTLSTGDFDVGASLSNAKVATILAELGQTRSGIQGRVDMNSRLEGRLDDEDLLKGAGTGRLSGANLYELPFLVQTLNLLRITPTEDVAFTDGETEFSIFGENVHFNQLTLWGDLVALDGGGTLSRLEYLDMKFNTRVSPQNLFSKVLSPLRDPSYTFWTIEVDGPVGSPTIQRKALSGVSQTLEDWFPGLVRSTTATATR